MREPLECPHDATKYVAPGGLLCFECIPDSYKKRYPDWQRHVEVAQARAAQARKNFSKQVQA
jgi:hypothetical protein